MNWEIGKDTYIYTTLYKIDNMRNYCILQGEEKEGIIYL